jgi:hypothetical protein
MHDNYLVILFMSHPKYDEQIFDENGDMLQALPVPFHQNISLSAGEEI